MEFDEVLYKKLKENICEKFRMRACEKQKELFIDYIYKLAEQHNVNYFEENFQSEKNKNLFLGDFNEGSVILCAHYDTKIKTKIKSFKLQREPNPYNYNDNSSGIISTLLHLQNKNVSIILFDNEEKQLKGSKLFAKYNINKYKNNIFINLDSVGLGKYLIIETNKISKNEKIIIESFFSKDRLANRNISC